MTENSVFYFFETMNGQRITPLLLFVYIFLLVLGLSIIFLNGVVLQTLHQNLHKLEVTNLFVFSLAIADVFTGVFLCYNTAYNFINFQNFEECLLRYSVFQVFNISSVLHLCILTMDRWVKIIFPFSYVKVFQTNLVMSISGIVWTIATIIGLLPVMGWNQKPDNENQPECTFFGVLPRSYLLLTVILFLVPLIMMIVMYIQIFRVSRLHMKRIAIGQSDQDDTATTWKTTKTVLLIIGTYFISWTPTGIIVIMVLGGVLDNNTNTENGKLLLYSTTAAFLNSLSNPVLYAMKIPFLKMKFMKIFCNRFSCLKRNRVAADG